MRGTLKFAHLESFHPISIHPPSTHPLPHSIHPPSSQIPFHSAVCRSQKCIEDGVSPTESVTLPRDEHTRMLEEMNTLKREVAQMRANGGSLSLLPIQAEAEVRETERDGCLEEGSGALKMEVAQMQTHEGRFHPLAPPSSWLGLG